MKWNFVINNKQVGNRYTQSDVVCTFISKSLYFRSIPFKMESSNNYKTWKLKGHIHIATFISRDNTTRARNALNGESNNNYPKFRMINESRQFARMFSLTSKTCNSYPVRKSGLPISSSSHSITTVRA